MIAGWSSGAPALGRREAAGRAAEGTTMKTVATGLGVLGLGLALLAGSAHGDEARTLKGEYVWTKGGESGDLQAVFTPTGQDSWDVAFHFTFKGDPHVYSGSAQGPLSAGDLAGKVQNENKRRTFTFEGRVENGVFKGTHSEVEDGKETDTGTLTLRAGE
jgi:hypothetical protein